MSTFETALKFWWGPPKWWGPRCLPHSKSAPAEEHSTCSKVRSVAEMHKSHHACQQFTHSLYTL